MKKPGAEPLRVRRGSDAEGGFHAGPEGGLVRIEAREALDLPRILVAVRRDEKKCHIRADAAPCVEYRQQGGLYSQAAVVITTSCLAGDCNRQLTGLKSFKAHAQEDG